METIPAVESSPVSSPETSVPNQTDPFHVDEAVLATLSPESRTAVEPLIQGWKKSAIETIEKEKSSAKSLSEKAEALDKLVSDERFVKWYQEEVTGTRQKQLPPSTTPTEKKAIVTPQEWNEALQKAANGDPSEYEALNRKIAEHAIKPTLESFDRKQKEMALSIEFDNMMRNHPDARDLDSIRVGDDSKSPSLLEMALYYVHDLRGRSMEEAYRSAKAMESAIMGRAKKEAMNLVNDKKASVTEGAPTSVSSGENIVYVDSPEKVLREQIKQDMSGNKVKVVFKR